MILRFLFFLFIFYLAFKLVFNIILPIYRTTRRVKSTIREMRARAENPAGGRERQETQDPYYNQKESQPGKVGEYIDFEEIK